MPEMSLSEWYKSGGHLPPETSDPIPDAPSFGMRDIFAMSGMPRDKADALANQYKPAVKMKDGGSASLKNSGSQVDLAPYGLRHSGQGAKGSGYFGPMRGREGVVTELSAEDDDGEYPLVVPTLTREELDHLLSGGEPTEMIHQKAKSYAEMRRAADKDTFADPSELRYPMPEDNYAAGGLAGGGTAQSYTTLTARGEAQRRGLRPQDFGGNDWNYQTLSNALNANIISGQSRRNPRILATPASTQPAPTQESVLGDINKYGIDYTARFGNETNVGGYNNTGLTQKGYNVAQTGFNDRLANLEKAALAQGISPADFQTNLNKSLQSGQEFYKEADRRFQKEDNRGGVLGFLDKATPIITKAGAMYIGGGMLESPFASTMAMPGTNIPLNTVTQGANTALKIYNEMGKQPASFAQGGLVNMADGGQAFPLKDDFAAEMERRRNRPRTRAGVPVEDTNVLGGALGGLGEMFQGAARGYGATMLGGPADILNLVDIPKVMTGESYQIPYGSEYFKEKLPFAPTTQTGKVAQELGGFVPIDPSKLVKAGVTGAKKVGQYLSPEIANLLEAEMKRSGMMMPIAPEGKAAKVKAPANDLGFYSNVEKAALNLQRKSGTGDSFLADLLKNPGVSESRLDEMGLTALRGKKNVTADEVRALASENKVPLTESKKIERDETAIEELESEYEDLSREFNELSGTGNPKAVMRLSDEIDRNLMEQKRLKSMPEARFGPSAYPGYSMPGGTDYREIRVKVPVKRLTEEEARSVLNAKPDAKLTESDIDFASKKAKEPFMNTTHHGNESNVLFHLRLANHADAEGKKGLLIDELQSDWHQAGRDKGYKKELTEEEKKEIKDLLRKKFIPEGQSTADVQRMRELESKQSGVPDAPFKDNWYQLGLKRAIKEATDSGMDRVYLTTGATQAERYDLSKQIGSLSIKPKPNNIVSINAYKDGEVVIMKDVPKDQLADYIGKDMAKKAINDIDAGKDALYSDLDLKVGGEGMKQYYDKTYLNWLKKYAKEHNAEVGMTKLSGSGSKDELAAKVYGQGETYKNLPSEGKRKINEMFSEGETVYYLDLNPKLKNTAKKGQSYKTGGSVNKPAQTLSEWYLSGGHLPR